MPQKAIKIKVTDLKWEWQYISVILLGLIVSTVHIDIFYYSHDIPKWFVFDIVTTLFIVYTLRHKALLELSYVGLIVTVLVYLMLISLWWAPHKVAGIEFIIRFINSALFVYCLTLTFSREKLTDLVLNTIFISALGFSLLFIIERYILEIPFNVGNFSPVGFINNTSAVFNIWIPGLVIFLVKNRHSYLKLGLAAITLLFVVGILMEAGTRGAILGLSISEIIIFFMVLRKNAKKAIAFLSITALLLLGIGIYNVSDSLQSGRLDAKLNVMKNNISRAGDSRLFMFKNTWGMTKDNPFGVGVNNFEYVHPKYAKVGTSDASPYVNENQILRTPHNFILKVFSELGFLGGILFVLLLGYCFVLALMNAWRGDFVDKWLFVGVSATLFHSMVSAVILTPVSLLFFCFILSAIFARKSNNAIKPHTLFSMKLPKIGKIAYFLIIVFAFLSIISEFYAFKGRTTFDGDKLVSAVQFNPQNDRALLNLSQYYFYREREVEKSLEAIDQFLIAYPYHIAGLMMKAERHYQLDELMSANETLTLLLTIYPTYKKAIRLEKLVGIKLRRKKQVSSD